MYHTLHDTIYWMENFVDREYKIHLTVARVGLYYLLELGNSPVVPFNGERYVNGMKKGLAKLLEAQVLLIQVPKGRNPQIITVEEFIFSVVSGYVFCPLGIRVCKEW